MNRKHFIGYLALGAGTIITGLKLAEPKKVVPAKVKEIEKIALLDWTDDQIREGFRRQFGSEAREVIRIASMTQENQAWVAIGSGGKPVVYGMNYKTLRSDGLMISARTEHMGDRTFHELTDSFKSFMQEIS